MRPTIPILLYSLLPTLVCAGFACRQPSSNPAPETPVVRKVAVVRTPSGFQLLREGLPYHVKGASGQMRLDLLRDAGGNSIRTYTAGGLDTLLDQAQALGLSVMVGIYLGRECDGFDYSNPQAVQRQTAKALETVSRYKNHPAVLCWALGNELDNEVRQTRALWEYVNQLALAVKAADPEHPVTTCVAFWPHTMKQLDQYAPALDFVAINAFGSLWEVAGFFRQKKSSNLRPYLITEWGVLGPWERPDTKWSAPVEQSTREKIHQIRSSFRHIEADSTHCLGSYLFYWGQKQETTATWFSFFTETGEKTALVDLMYELWNERRPKNRAPVADTLFVNGRSPDPAAGFFKAGIHLSVSVQANDPDGDLLTYDWECVPEGFIFNPEDISGERKPDTVRGLIAGRQDNYIRFRVPAKTGPYRLFVFVRDGKGGAGYASMPFFSINHDLVEK